MPFVVKPLNESMSIDISIIIPLPIGIRFPKLDVKHRDLDSLNKTKSLLGILIKMNKNTTDNYMMNYARLLIDIAIEGPFLEFVQFINAYDTLVR